VLATAGWPQAGVSLALVGVYAAPYAVRARRLRTRGRAVPARRLACFGSGLLLLAAAVSPPVDKAADDRLSAHMLE
jgi:cytochrome c oxidase assembly factor CtaG